MPDHDCVFLEYLTKTVGKKTWLQDFKLLRPGEIININGKIGWNCAFELGLFC